MDATSTIQDSIHVFNLVHKYVSRILGTYQTAEQGVYYISALPFALPVLRFILLYISYYSLW